MQFFFKWCDPEGVFGSKSSNRASLQTQKIWQKWWNASGANMEGIRGHLIMWSVTSVREIVEREPSEMFSN